MEMTSVPFNENDYKENYAEYERVLYGSYEFIKSIGFWAYMYLSIIDYLKNKQSIMSYINFYYNKKKSNAFYHFMRFRFWHWFEMRGIEHKCWISVWRGWGFRFTIAPAGYFDRRPQIHFCFIWGNVLIRLPFITKYDECDPPTYGFYYYERCFWIKKRRKTKCLHLPYEYDWYRSSYLLADNVTWKHIKKGDNDYFIWQDENKKTRWAEDYPYTYTLESGEIQQRIATVMVSEREWRMRWLKWTSWMAKVRRTIDVKFNDEVGERTGSWKGGVRGISYEIKPNETPLECLRRMEVELQF